MPSNIDESHYECFSYKGMHFVHSNVTSLIPKISDLRILATKSKPFVIAVCETWLDQSVSDAEIKIDRYHVLRRDRERTKGGVCLYIHSRYAFTPLENVSKDKDQEPIWVNLFLPNIKPIQIVLCYRPPCQVNFTELFEQSLQMTRSDC
jgi:hypothetical protein